MKSKRADIAISILVIGIAAVCTVALMSFYLTNQKFVKSFNGVGTVKDMNVKIEQFRFYSQILAEKSREKIAEMAGLRLVKSAIGEKLVFERDNGFIKKVEYVLNR